MASVIFVRRGSTGERAGETDFCEPNLNILAHAQAIELEIGSRCGGHGKCGGDRIRVLKSSHPMSKIRESELRLLTDEERASGMRLACQCFPENPQDTITIEIDL